jgi:hypothetical protein
MNAFDHVANSIQVALGAIDQEAVPKLPEVVDAIAKLKDAKQVALDASATYTKQMAEFRKMIVNLETVEHAPAPEPEPEKHKSSLFKSDAKHPSPQPPKKK